MTDTEGSQTISSVFLTNGKQKKHLQPSTKYPMRLCKACNIHIAENYLSNHKRTSKHLANQANKEEREKRNNVNYINDKLNQEIRDLEYKLRSFEDGKESINKSITKLEQEFYKISDEYANLHESLNLKSYEIKQMQKEINNFNETINKINDELNTKRQILNYTMNVN
jgi:chromosome segregation ATPase